MSVETTESRASTEPIRVLILYMESTGAGHRRAAEAVASALGERPGVKVTLVNIVDFMNDALHQLYQSFRTRILEDAPHIFGQLYSWYDHEKDETSFIDRLLFEIERQSLRRLVEFLKKSPHDVAIHTHFFPAELTAHLRRTERVRFPHVTVTTDYFSHAMWFHQPCECFFVATPDAGVYLEHLGAAPEAIELTGIPVDPVFESLRLDADAHDRQTAERWDDIASGRRRPRVVFMATGTAPEAAREAQAHLLSTRVPIEVVTLAGGDEERQAALSEIEVPARHEARVMGPTDRVPHILSEADLLVGKSGGLTSAEAMAMGCPMAILEPRPDQEEQNTDVLLEQGAAVRVFRTPLLGPKIERVFAEGDTWTRLRRNAHRMGRPDAARRVADAALSLVRRGARVGGETSS